MKHVTWMFLFGATVAAAAHGDDPLFAVCAP
jgi:hypothetical protein